MNFRALCPHCDTASRYSGEWQGRQLICGNAECGRSFTPEFVVEDKPKKPAARPAAPLAAPAWAEPVAPSADEFQLVEPVAPSGDEFQLVEPTDAPLAEPLRTARPKPAAPIGRPIAPRPIAPFAKPVVPMALPVAAPFASPVPTQPCPRCGQLVPSDATLCTACGTNLETGRRTVKAKPWNKEEEKEDLRSGWLRLVSLWAPGIFPYASEAPLRRPPWGLLAIVALILVCYPISFLPWSELHLFTWIGDPEQRRVEIAKMAGGAAVEPRIGTFAFHQLVTSQFMHAGIEHMIFNLVVLMVFGAKVNDLLGNWWFLLAFLGLGIAADMSHLYEHHGGPAAAGLGASGSIMGIAGMYAVFSPQHRVRIVAWTRAYVMSFVILSLGVSWALARADDSVADQAATGMRFLLFGLLMLAVAVLTIISFLAWLSGSKALNPFVSPMCFVFRVRGLWLVLFFVGLDLLSILFGSDDNVGHGVHFIGFLSGAIVAAFLVATRAIRCGGYDLLTWCYGQEDLEGDLAVEDPKAASWGTFGNQPEFFVALIVVGVIGLAAGIVRVVTILWGGSP